MNEVERVERKILKSEKQIKIERLVERNEGLISEKEAEILNAMIWNECENMRHKLNRKYDHICAKHTKKDRVYCAGTEFRDRVAESVLYSISSYRLRNKKVRSMKRLIRKAIYGVWILNYGA